MKCYYCENKKPEPSAPSDSESTLKSGLSQIYLKGDLLPQRERPMRVLLTWLLDLCQKSSEAVNPAGSGVNLPLFQLPQNYHPTPCEQPKLESYFPS